MQVKSIAECSGEHSAILLTIIKLPFAIKTFLSSFFERPFYTGFTVYSQHKILVLIAGVSSFFAACIHKV